ncbi:unnamed protein product [Paramecium octaurelia]|uniref:Uncharacterized protein n=1 Tax=Paramecium octaurelia TaxID=43137 RepID=A0A8S1VZ47_PAROT|nr:unnamed protein product [Paramecium octaurelia]
MQVLCQYALPQFYAVSNIVSSVYLMTKISSLNSDWPNLVMGILQFLLSLTLLTMIAVKNRLKIRKPHVLAVACCFSALSIILAIQKFDHYYLLLIILQQLVCCLLISLLVLSKNRIGLGVVSQLYLIGIFIDAFSIDIWVFEDQFSQSRAIAIFGSGGFGLLTLFLILLCHFNRKGKLQNELHIIIGFYIFCELFTCCSITAELVNGVQSMYLVDLLLLKISNVFLDMLIYPFVKFREVKLENKMEHFENCNERQVESGGIQTKESECELDSALKIRGARQTVVRKEEEPVTNRWIRCLLEIN